MTLLVPFDQFAKTVLRLLDTKEAFVSPKGSGSVATAASVNKSVLIVSPSDEPIEAARKHLTKGGLEVFEGIWSLSVEIDAPEVAHRDAFIAAVSYKSGESTPGLWVDAYPERPTQVQVLRALYEEFRETGELPEVSFEEFIRLSEPNVVIVSPVDIQSFMDSKKECE